MPVCFAQGLSILLGNIVYYLPTSRRRVLLSNLNHAFEERPICWQRRIARSSCKRMVEMGLFALASPFMSEKRLRENFSLDDESYAFIHDELEKGNHSYLVLVPHFCSMEAITLIELLVGKKLPQAGVIYRPLKSPALEGYVKQTRERFGLKLLSRKEGFNGAINILRDKGTVAILFDQNAGHRGAQALFFDRLAATTELPGMLVEKFKPKTGFLYAKRTGFWKATLQSEMLECEKTSEAITLAANAWLENKLREDEGLCQDWLWLHTRWKTQDEPCRRFRIEARKQLLPKTLPKKTRLFIRMPNWLGDVVMALPLIRAIAKGRPDMQITLIAQKPFMGLLQKLNIADEYIALPNKKSYAYFLNFLSLRKKLPDVQLMFTNSTRGDLEAKIIGAKQRFGIERTKKRGLLTHTWKLPQNLNEKDIHQTHLWEKFLQHFGLKEALDYTPLKWPSSQKKSHTIGMICGTENMPEKRWPIAHWRELIEKILTQYPDATIELYGTANDLAITKEVAHRFDPKKVINLAGQTNLLEFIEHLNNCTQVICNDTGGMHLANMIGTQLIAIFGPTNPVRTGPIFSGSTTILQPEGCPQTGGMDMGQVSTDEVMTALSI